MKTRFIVWAVVLFVLFAAFVVMTFATIFKIAGAFIISTVISYWIGYMRGHHNASTKV